MVQDGIDVMEDVPFGDGGVGIVGAELFERPVGDVLAAVGAYLCWLRLRPRVPQLRLVFASNVS